MSQIREFKRYNLKFKTSSKSAHGVWAEKEGLIFMEKRESGICTFGDVGFVPGFSKHCLRDLIDEAKVWVLGGRIERYKFIKPALSCLKSDLWNQDLNHQTYASFYVDYESSNDLFSNPVQIGFTSKLFYAKAYFFFDPGTHGAP